MKLFKRILLVLLILIVGAGIYYYPKLKRVYHAMHLFDEADIVNNLRTVNEWWSSRTISQAEEEQVFPNGASIAMPDVFTVSGQNIKPADYLNSTYTTGLSLIHI